MTIDLKDEFNKVKAESLELINKAKSESRDLTAEEREQNDKRFSRLDAIKATLKAEAKAASYELDKYEAVKEMAKQAFEPTAKSQAEGKLDRKSKGTAYAQLEGKKIDREQYDAMREEYNEWVRAEKQNFALITTSGSSALLPTVITDPKAIRRLNNGLLAGVLATGYQPLYTAGTETYQLPIFDDSSNDAANTAENASAATLQDSGLSDIVLGATLYDSKAMFFSNSLLLAPGFDLVTYAMPHLDKRIDHKQQAVWTASVTSTATVGKTTASASGFTFAEILAFYHSVPAVYRSDLFFNFADTAVQVLRGLTDNYGRPIYLESLSSEMPDTLFGKPMFVNDSLTAVGANAISGIAASGECVIPRICTNKRLAKYANVVQYPDQFGIQEFVNAGFGFITNGVRTLTMGAS